MAKSLNVLVLEDNVTDFLLLEHRLQQDGLNARFQQVHGRKDLADALKMDHWDIVLSDDSLAGVIFEETLSDIRAHHPDVPVIRVSTTLEEATAVRLLKQGGRDFAHMDRLASLKPAIERAVNDARAQRNRRESGARLRQLNRMYAVLNGINEAIMHNHDMESLLGECCSIAVEQGGFLMARVGLVDADNQEVRVITHSGNTGDRPGRGTAGHTLRQGKASICNDITRDRGMSPWREDALCPDCRSVAAFPISVGGKVHYALSLYADQAGIFDDEAVRLLERLAGNIGSALDAINSEHRRLEAESALRASEERFRHALSANDDGVWEWDLTTSTVYYSPRWKAMLGYLEGELENDICSLERLVQPEDWRKTRALIDNCIAQGSDRFSTEYRMRHKDGRQVDILSRGRVVREANGKPARVVGTHMDVTSQHKMKRDLAEAQRIAHVGYWQLDLAEVRLTWSDEIYRIFEIDPERFGACYEAFLELVHPEDQEKVDHAYEKHLLENAPYEIEHRLLMPDGRIKHVLERCETERDANGTPVCSLGTIQDITHHKELEQQLLESREWTSKIINSVPDTVLVVDQEGRIVRANTQAELMFGYRFEELVNQHVDMLVPPQHGLPCEPDTGPVTAPAHPGNTTGMGTQGLRKDGSLFPVDISATPLQTESQHQVIVTIRDITRLREDEIVKHQDQEQQITLRKLLEATLADGTQEETLGKCMELVLAVSWLSLLPKGGVFLMDENEQQLRLAVTRNLAMEIQTLCARVPLGRCHCGRAAATCEVQYAHCVDEKHEITYPGIPEHGHYSMPLLSSGELLGVLVLYLPPEFERDALKEQFLASVADILAGYINRKQHEDRLRRSAAVLNSTHDGVIVTDLNSRVVAINPAFTKITGYSEAEVLGKTPALLRSRHHDDAFYQQLWVSVKQTGFWQSEIWNRRKNGEIYPEWLTISAVHDERGTVVNYVGVFTDISSVKQAEERLSHLAHHDALTGLPNRLLLQTLLKHALFQARRDNQVLAVLFMDLDRFKHVNDSLGHTAGDELLKIAADRLRKRVRESDTIARLGGDEFILLLEGLHGADDAANVARDLIELFKAPFRLACGHEVYVGASIGISIFPNDSDSADQLVRNADTAMYNAKEGGRNTYRFYEEALTRRAEQLLRLESRLRHALELEEMLLHYQPLIGHARCKGVEALVRWQDPEEGLVSPMQFIPLAEETGLIIPLGAWVLRTACAQMKAWLDAGMALETMAVNLSPVQFQQADFAQQLQAILQETGLPAAYLELEITEGAIMGQGEEAETKLAVLQSLGVKLTIDDFGTGYSSLAYLKRFPIHKLKIDQSFVRDIPDNPASMEIAAAIIAMGRNLKLEVLAEGVETPQQLAYLQSQGCDTFQGYLFSRPVPAGDIPEILQQKFDGYPRK